MLTFCNSYILWLLCCVQLRLVTVTFCDIDVVWCYVLSQYHFVSSSYMYSVQLEDFPYDLTEYFQALTLFLSIGRIFPIQNTCFLSVSYSFFSLHLRSPVHVVPPLYALRSFMMQILDRSLQRLSPRLFSSSSCLLRYFSGPSVFEFFKMGLSWCPLALWNSRPHDLFSSSPQQIQKCINSLMGTDILSLYVH